MNLDSLANGLGLIYWTESDGITVTHNLNNNCDGLLATLKDAVNKAPVSGPIEAVGKIQITAVDPGGDNVLSVVVNAVEQMGGSVATTIGDAEKTARDVRDGINAFIPISGPSYTATTQGDTVYIHAPDGTGTSVNGHAILAFSSGSTTFGITNMSGATDGNEIVSACANRRYFYDADFGPNDCSGEGSAVDNDVQYAREITAAIVMRGEQLKRIKLDEEVGAIDKNALKYTRTTNTHYITANMPGAGSEDLNDIVPSEYIYGDILYLSGAAAAKVVTLKSGVGNILLTDGVDFVTTNAAKIIVLQLKSVPTGPVWVEVTRGTPIDLIGAGYIVASMLDTDSVETDKILDGAVTNPKLATDAVSTMKIVNLAVSTAKIANDGVTNDKMAPDSVDTLEIIDDAVTTPKVVNGAITNDKIADSTISAVKLDSETATETLSLHISAETGELGEYQIPVDFKCDVIEVISRINFLVEATDDWTIQPANGTGNMDVTVTHLAGAAFGDTQSVVPTTNTEILAGGVIKLTSAKITPGGKANIFVKVRRKV
jgi:hypothetical protein